LLSAIAVPTCRNRNSPKSHQGEAKIQLISIYNSQIGTLSDYDSFATCLEDMGYEQSPRGYYIVGFNQIDPDTRKLITLKGHKCESSNTIIPKILLSKNITIKDLPTTLITSKTFTAAAIGRLVNDPDYLLDIWTIDETKKIVHVQDGSERISFWKRFKRDYLD
jgi:hypothetical protein